MFAVYRIEEQEKGNYKLYFAHITERVLKLVDIVHVLGDNSKQQIVFILIFKFKTNEMKKSV